MTLPFFEPSAATLKVRFQNLIPKDQAIVEHAYKAYYDKTEGKIWRSDETGQPIFLKNTQGDPIMIKSTLAEVVKEGPMHTVDGWATFVSAIKLYKQEPLTQENIQEAFDRGYRSGAEGKSYTDSSLPYFKELLDIQKEAWLAAARAVQTYSPAPVAQQQEEAVASERCTMSP